MPSPATTILFGAFDRHNLGDLLFPHIVAAFLPGLPVYRAGLAARDLRPYGGHLVSGLVDLARELGSVPVNLVHVGGEILTCSAWDAALMVADPESARQALSDAGPAARYAEQQQWANALLNTTARAPYVASKMLFAHPGAFILASVGGSTLANADALLRAEVLQTLRTADQVTVRDTRTRDCLWGYGVEAGLAPDPGVLVTELFGSRIAAHSTCGEVAAIRKIFPGGYLAAQFSSDFADDATLDTLAAQFDLIIDDTHLSLVFFRAGAAPMHDDLALYSKVRDRMRCRARTILFESLNIWDICGLIGASEGFVGSSLHGRIVALAHGLPRVSIAAEPGAPGKQLAFVETWEDTAMPGVVGVGNIADAARASMRVPRQSSLALARHLTDRYRDACAGWVSLLR